MRSILGGGRGGLMLAAMLMFALFLTPGLCASEQNERSKPDAVDVSKTTVAGAPLAEVVELAPVKAYGIGNGFYWSDRPLKVLDGKAVYADSGAPFIVNGIQIRADTW